MENIIKLILCSFRSDDLKRTKNKFLLKAITDIQNNSPDRKWKKLSILSGHTYAITNIVQLKDRSLIASTQLYSPIVKVWNYIHSHLIAELDNGSNIKGLITLSNGGLVSFGKNDCTIWNDLVKFHSIMIDSTITCVLEIKQQGIAIAYAESIQFYQGTDYSVIKTLKCSYPIVSFKILKCQDIAVLSCRNSLIEIYNPSFENICKLKDQTEVKLLELNGGSLLTISSRFIYHRNGPTYSIISSCRLEGFSIVDVKLLKNNNFIIIRGSCLVIFDQQYNRLKSIDFDHSFRPLVLADDSLAILKRVRVITNGSCEVYTDTFVKFVNTTNFKEHEIKVNFNKCHEMLISLKTEGLIYIDCNYCTFYVWR
jgi:hypothetical protein